MNKAPTFEQAGREWEQTLATMIQRNGRPLATNTVRIYTGTLNRLIEHMGKQKLPVSNRIIKEYVAKMRGEEYSPGVIVADLGVILSVHKAVTNDNGDCLYPLIINHEFCKTPIVDPENQNTPCATREDVERGLVASGFVPGLVAILSQGLRISEALALRVGDESGTDDAWDADSSMIHIRRTLKTPDAARTVYLPSELNLFLIAWYHGLKLKPRPGTRLFSASKSEVYRQLEIADLPAPHSFRRFRVTHCRKARMNEEVLQCLIGHRRAARTSTTTRYDRTRDDDNFIRAEIKKCGLGFNLPTIAAFEAQAVAVSA